jgi:hypothetical protein
MEAKITINGEEIFTDSKYDKARVALRNVAATENPTAKTPTDAVTKFPNVQAVADKLLAIADGDESAVIIFWEKPEGKTAETVAATYKVGNFARRLVLASKADDYSGDIAKKESKKEMGEKSEQSFDLA